MGTLGTLIIVPELLMGSSSRLRPALDDVLAELLSGSRFSGSELIPWQNSAIQFRRTHGGEIGKNNLSVFVLHLFGHFCGTYV